MKYRARFIEQKITEVVIEVNDDELNERFAELGDVTSDNVFSNEADPRWEIERIAYHAAFGDGISIDHNVYEDGGIVDRTIEALTEE